MIKTKNIILILLFLIILFICQHVFKKNSKQIEKYNSQSPKKFKTGSVTEFNKMIIGNSNGDLSSIGCPKGIIWLWSGSIENIPEGWALCNGENNTPDLRGKFVLGVNPNSKKNSNFMVNEMTAEGGKEKVKLEIRHLPRHNHPDNFNETGAGGDGTWYNSGGYRLRINSSKGFTGDDEPHDNMPPYFTLAYIMKNA
jgi:microcystin-dependent protein